MFTSGFIVVRETVNCSLGSRMSSGITDMLTQALVTMSVKVRSTKVCIKSALETTEKNIHLNLKRVDNKLWL